MTGWFIACTAALALIVVGLLIWSANAEARRARVITTVCASILIVLLAAAPSLYYNISSERGGRSEDSAISIQMQLGASGGANGGSSRAPTPTATINNEDTEQEENSMENKQERDIQRAIGMIEGIAVVADPKVGEALDCAVVLLEVALGEKHLADCGAWNETCAVADVALSPLRDAERYLPAEDGDYIVFVEGEVQGIPACYNDVTKVFTDVCGNEIAGVTHWMEMPTREAEG